MRESPWNAKRGTQPAAKPFTPEGAQVKHIPRHPPRAEQRPTARRKGRKEALIRQMEAQAAKPQPKPRGGRARQEKQRFPLFTAVLVGLMVIVLAVLSMVLIQNSSQLDALKKERAAIIEKQAQKVANHLSKRDESGYKGLIDAYAAEYQINPAFVAAIIKCESNYIPKAVSSANARGLMQIMPDTGTWLSGRLGTPNYTLERLFEPQLNIQYGAYYLSYLSNHFSGDPVMVSAAYHAGVNNVKLWAMKYAADKKSLSVDELPMSNTRDYVRKVMDAYAIYFEQDQMAKGAVPGDLPAVSSAVRDSH